MKTISINYNHIKGWGVDADAADHPNYPMKNYTGADHDRLDYERAEQQLPPVEILKSTERPVLSTVMGTTAPLRGLSGVLRSFAFRYSENRYRHWLTLLLADRVDEVEGVFSDIRKGTFPNFIRESGWPALWKHKPSMVVRKVIGKLLILGAVAGYFLYRRRQYAT